MKFFRDLPKITVNFVNLMMQVIEFVVIVVVFYVLYKLLLEQFFDGSKEILPMLGLWVLTSYFAIPRIHRILTNYYLPSYFVGRARSPSGFLSDPVNIAFFGSESDLHAAFSASDWQRADDLGPKTFIRTVYSAALKKSYPEAPVGNMYLFNRRQDFAYEQEVNGSPNQRHHVRFWKTPDNWYLPGGHKADWLAAATFDTHVGIKIATGQLDHFIHADIDQERDYLIETLDASGSIKKLEIAEHFTNAYHDRNNGGDHIQTDGSLPFISL